MTTTETIGADRGPKVSFCRDRHAAVARAQDARRGLSTRKASTPVVSWVTLRRDGCRGEVGCPAVADVDHGPCLCGTFAGWGRS